MRSEVLRLKACLPKMRLRDRASAFNRLHGPAMTVGRTWVSDTLSLHCYELPCLMREIRSRPPCPVAVNDTGRGCHARSGVATGTTADSGPSG